jgi:hypothetical protein
MAKRRLFSVNTPLGYRVGLSRDRWRQIVRYKHPALAGHEADVKECLQSPSLVRASALDADVHLYYQAARTKYLCVVVAPAGDREKFVVTAYFTKNVKQGDQLWKS